jgi:hypothetical protein
VLAAGVAAAQPAGGLPKAETVLDKYVEATGGKAAYAKLHSAVSTGSMEFTANGIRGTLTLWRARPDKSLMEINLEGIGKIREGSDGRVAWSLSAIQGPHLKEGDEKAEALRNSRFDADENWRAVFAKAETTAVETVEGKECYKLVMTPKEGSPVTRYYDRQSGLLLKVTMTVKSPMGEIPVESVASDYRKDGEILSAHKVTQKAAGQTFSISIDKTDYNVEIPPGKFDIPDEIKPLLEKK